MVDVWANLMAYNCFIFYTFVHYLLTIVMHSRPSLYDWALEHLFIIIIIIIETMAVSLIVYEIFNVKV